MKLGSFMKRALQHYGYEIVSSDPRNYHLQRRRLLFHNYQIDLVLDIGAADGGYGRELRSNDYRGRIVSFEPRTTAFHQLKAATEGDSAWEAIQYAVGSENGKVHIHVAANGDSSSIVDLASGSENYSASLRYIGQEEVPVTTLDAVFNKLRLGSNNILLKIDAQGFERSVLDGAQNSLQFIDTIQLEMSLTPMYKGQLPIHEMGTVLHQLGYTMVSVEPGFHEQQTGRLLEVDGIFHRYRVRKHEQT